LQSGSNPTVKFQAQSFEDLRLPKLSTENETSIKPHLQPMTSLEEHSDEYHSDHKPEQCNGYAHAIPRQDAVDSSFVNVGFEEEKEETKPANGNATKPTDTPHTNGGGDAKSHFTSVPSITIISHDGNEMERVLD